MVEALRLACLNTTKIVLASEDAVAAYNLDRKDNSSEILVFDMGKLLLEVTVFKKQLRKIKYTF